MNFNKRKEIVLTESLKVYEQFHAKGLISIYWYGSGLKDQDFREESDLDLMAIVEDSFSLAQEKEMIALLQTNTEVDLRIRILYLSELNGGPLKSNVAKWVPIQLWLMNFHEYVLLHGKKLSEREFQVKKANFAEACSREYDAFQTKREQFVQGNPGQAMYVIKSALFYLYYVACHNSEPFVFSYHTLGENVLEQHKQLVKDLIAIKNQGYDTEVLTRLLPEVTAAVDEAQNASTQMRHRVQAVILKEKKILLLINDANTGMSYPPGGGIDEGESKEEALQRELKEELGVDLIKYEFLFSYDSFNVVYQIPQREHNFFCEVEGTIVLEDGYESYRWCTIDEAKELKLPNGLSECLLCVLGAKRLVE